jgi:hypothetical protein
MNDHDNILPTVKRSPWLFRAMVVFLMAMVAGNATGEPQNGDAGRARVGPQEPSLVEQPSVDREPGAAPSATSHAVPSAAAGQVVPPEMVTRSTEGQTTVRAVRINQPLAIDGALSEEVYGLVQPVGGFIQQEPQEGAPATDQTEVWILFDDENLYIVVRCWNSQPEDQWVVNELLRDSYRITQGENISVSLDTFNDGRNGFFFQTNPAGAIRDQLFTDESQFNASWNTVWSVETGRFDGGWTAEMAIPFKSLRYGGSGAQQWGINFRRVLRWNNETSYLTQMPRAFGNMGIIRMSFAAALVGLETPEQSMNLEMKPYVVSALTTDRTADKPYSNSYGKNGGFDFKYGITRGLIADLTYRTDFAQVEEDVQQVNLTRFSLRFPEKREFFLEGQGNFAFGSARGGGNPYGQTADVPVLFFSRRIGLSKGRAVPVVAGGRVTGKVGQFSVGALNIKTAEEPAAGAFSTNFTVVRVKRDILRRSTVGVIATRRTPTGGAGDSNLALGIDTSMRFFTNLSVDGYYARTDTPGRAGDPTSYRGAVDYRGDRYGMQLNHLLVGEGFNPEIGFMRRLAFRRTSALARFSPRPASSRLIRRLSYEARYDYITNPAGDIVENKDLQGSFRIDFNSGDRMSAAYTRNYEFVPEAFHTEGLKVAMGAYRMQDVRVQYDMGPQHFFSGRASATRGSFYGGDRTEISYRGRLSFSARFSLEPGVEVNWIDLPQGNVVSRLLTTRATFSMSPRMLVSSLAQYNALNTSLSSSVRFRWEYIPGSEIFAVYNDGRDTSVSGIPYVMNRSFVVKVTRLLRF